MLCAVGDHLAISSSVRAAKYAASPGLLLHGPWDRDGSYLACKARSCLLSLDETRRNSMTKVAMCIGKAGVSRSYRIPCAMYRSVLIANA